MENRVMKHPILGDLAPAREVTVTVDGKKLKAREGEVIAAVLMKMSQMWLTTSFLA
jgi:hypothetical protein